MEESEEDEYCGGVLARYDLATGKLIARLPLGREVFADRLAADEAGVLLGGPEPESPVWHVSARTNESRVLIPNAPATTASLADGVLYLTDGRFLRAFDAADGQPLWTLTGDTLGMATEPAGAGALLLVPTDSGLLCLTAGALTLLA
jgi:outer membrane protein assembly factor BamB